MRMSTFSWNKNVMLLVAIFMLVLPNFAQTGNDLVETISLSGYVKTDVGSMNSTQITLYANGKKIRSVYPNAQGKYELELNFQTDYEIVFSSDGNASKRMLVNTETKGDDDEYDIPTLNFNIQLPKSTGGPIDEAYEKPVSKLFVDESLGQFNRDSKVEADFKAYLKKKTDEQKKWEEEQKNLDAQKKKEEEERKREEELARKKALEDARLAEANKLKAEAAEKERLEKERIAQMKADQDAKKKAEQDALLAEQEKLRQQDILRKEEAEAKKKEAEAKRLEEIESAKNRELQAQQDKKAQQEKLKAEQDALAQAKRDAEANEALRKQQEADLVARQKADAEARRQAEMLEAEKNAQARAEQNKREFRSKDYDQQLRIIDSVNQSTRRRELSVDEYNQRKREKIAQLKSNRNFEIILEKDSEKGKIAARKTDENHKKTWAEKAKEKEADANKQAIIARQQKIAADDANMNNEKSLELDKRKQSKAEIEIAEREAKRQAFLDAKKAKEEEKEVARAALLKEAMEKGNIPILTPFIYNDGKFVGTVNYNDGRGNIPVTEEEFKRIQESIAKQ